MVKIYKRKLFVSILVVFLSIVFIYNLHTIFDKKDSASDILETESALFSQDKEELIIRDFFNDKRNGFFVDVGCSHWHQISNTLYLEKYLNWSGIGVDALAEFASGYEKYRPNTKFFNFIVTDHSGTIEPFYCQEENLFTSSSNIEFLRKFDKRLRTITPYKTIYVPTITLNELLEKNNIKKIDFLNIDVQGSELNVLAGFDIEKYKPELVCIESTLSDKRKILDYFRKHNYERIDKYLKYDKRNWYFKPRSK